MKLVTFNIRCSWDGDGINCFIHRAGEIIRKIQEEDPDVVCFQECTQKIFDFLEGALSNYTLVFNQRGPDRDGEGLATAIRRGVRLIGLDSFWLSPTPNIPGSRYEEQSQCPRICQCLTLKYHNTFFRIYNIHLDHKSDLARQLGMEATLRRIGEDLTRDKLPFFVLGDFNCKPDGSPIALCMNNSYAEMKELTDAIKHTFHNYGRIESDHKIDYIFSDPNTARLLDSVSAWTDEHHGIYLSDHYPLAVEIQF